MQSVRANVFPFVSIILEEEYVSRILVFSYSDRYETRVS